MEFTNTDLANSLNRGFIGEDLNSIYALQPRYRLTRVGVVFYINF